MRNKDPKTAEQGKKADVIKLKPKTAPSGAKCLGCAKPATAKYSPFCSKRCADLDLGRWLDGGYRIETNQVPDRDSGDDEEY